MCLAQRHNAVTPVSTNTQPLCLCAPCIFSVSYGTVCASVREDNPRDLASGLSSIHMHNFLLRQHAFALCTLRDIRIKTLEYQYKMK